MNPVIWDYERRYFENPRNLEQEKGLGKSECLRRKGSEVFVNNFFFLSLSVNSMTGRVMCCRLVT